MKKLNQKGFGHIELLLVTVAVMLIGAVGWYVYQKQNDSVNNSVEITDETEQLSTLPDDISGVLPVEEIQTQAASDTNDKEVQSIQLETDDGVLVYVVHFTDGSQLVYNARTGDRVTTDNKFESEDEDSASIPRDFKPTVSISQAIVTAKQKRPNVAVTKVEVEVEEGQVVYSVRFADGGRVDISAGSGAITRVRQANGEETKTQDQNDDSSDDSGNETENESGDDSRKRSETDDNKSGSSNDDDNEDRSGSNSGSN